MNGSLFDDNEIPAPKLGMDCPKCGGSGKWHETTASGHVPFDAERGECSECKGTGRVADTGQLIVVRSHTRHIREGIEKRNKKRPKKRKEPLADQFARYHKANPKVYNRLVEMARELKAMGVQQYGLAALWEALRYESLTTQKTDGMPFKLSNNHRAYYARLIHDQESDLAGFFRLREVTNK